MLVLGILCCQQVINQKAAKVSETLTALHTKKPWVCLIENDAHDFQDILKQLTMKKYLIGTAILTLQFYFFIFYVHTLLYV